MGLFRKKEKIVYGCNLTVNGSRIDNSLSRKLRGVTKPGTTVPSDDTAVGQEETFTAGYAGVQSASGYPSGDDPAFGFNQDISGLDALSGGVSPVAEEPQWGSSFEFEESLGSGGIRDAGVRNDMPPGVPFEKAVAEELENTFRGYGGEILTDLTLPDDCGLEDDEGNPPRLDIVAVFPSGLVVIGCVDWNGVIDCCSDIDAEWSMQSRFGDILGYFSPVRTNDDNILALCEYLGISDSYASSAIVFSSTSELQHIPAPIEHYCVGMFTDLQKFLIDIMCEDGQQLPRLEQIKSKLRQLQ